MDKKTEAALTMFKGAGMLLGEIVSDKARGLGRDLTGHDTVEGAVSELGRAASAALRDVGPQVDRLVNAALSAVEKLSDTLDEAGSENAEPPRPVVIRPATPDDAPEILTVQKLAFGRDVVPEMIEKLGATVSLVAVVDNKIVGHVMSSPATLDTEQRPVAVQTLTPLGVLVEHRGRGIGAALVNELVAALDRQGEPLVFLEGSPSYYAKLGFVQGEPEFRRPTLRIPLDGFQVHKLGAWEPWMVGSFLYPQTFWDLDVVGLRTGPPDTAR